MTDQPTTIPTPPGALGADGHGAHPAAASDPALVTAVEQFLYEEAERLDDRRFDAWLELFTEDAVYEAPIRVTRDVGSRPEVSERGRIFADTKDSLRVRVARLQSEYAWAEQPPSRTRHYVTNVRVRRLPDGAVAARSNLLVFRNRGEDTRHDLYAADRHDELVQAVDGGFRIRRRWLVVDQSNLTGNSLSVFL